jgi:hypothetical protein
MKLCRLRFAKRFRILAGIRLLSSCRATFLKYSRLDRAFSHAAELYVALLATFMAADDLHCRPTALRCVSNSVDTGTGMAANRLKKTKIHAMVGRTRPTSRRRRKTSAVRSLSPISRYTEPVTAANAAAAAALRNCLTLRPNCHVTRFTYNDENVVRWSMHGGV